MPAGRNACSAAHKLARGSRLQRQGLMFGGRNERFVLDRSKDQPDEPRPIRPGLAAPVALGAARDQPRPPERPINGGCYTFVPCANRLCAIAISFVQIQCHRRAGSQALTRNVSARRHLKLTRERGGAPFAVTLILEGQSQMCPDRINSNVTIPPMRRTWPFSERSSGQRRNQSTA
jgi:hypothetical protein